METFFKRYFWTVGLAIIAVLALLNGKSVTNILGTLLIPTPGNITIVKPRVSKGPTVKKSRYVEARNIFNSAASEEVLDAEEGLDEALEPGDDVPDTDLNLTLAGSIYSPNPEWSVALITEGSETRLFQIGQKVKPDAELVGIWAEEAWIARGTDGPRKIEKIRGAKRGAKGSKPSYKGNNKLSSSSKSASASATEKLKKGIKRKSASEYEIDRAMLEEQLSDLNKLGTQARIIPHYKDGKANGFKLVGIRPGSLYSHIGIRSGDVIRGVNGMEINSPTKALQIYEKLKTADSISVSLERRGQKKDLTYKIR